LGSSLGRNEGGAVNEQQTPVLSATGLTKSFGAFTAVRDVSISVNPSEAVALIGPNGAGKTTLFDLLTGRIRPDRGDVALFGRNVTTEPPWKRVRGGLSRSFQVSSVFPSLSAIENVQIGLVLAYRTAWRLFGIAANAYREEARTLLEHVGLTDHMNRKAGELSYGDQRALELAVALSSHPKILLLDEPTAGMGVEETDECLGRIKAIAAEHRIPVLFVEHDMKVVFDFATRIIVLSAGQVLVDGPPEVVRGDERVREAYFGESI
jgi:branched-chain amino acid transport system ATP-binding protein